MNTIEKTTSKQALPVHIKQKVNKDTGVQEYYCTICQKSFSRTQKYYHYGCNNVELKKHKCDLCEKCFATRSHLNYHLETHNSETYQCPDCSKSFTNYIVFKKHTKIHQRTITHLCTYCNKEFKNKETLAAHIARHNNELNFKCDICSAKYATKSTLEQHKLSHFAKKHECPKCGKRFQRNSILTQHLKRHAKTDTFLHACPMCSKRFCHITAMQRHIKMHQTDGITKYKCLQCDIITARKDNMQRHIRNMHTGMRFSDCVETLQPTEIEQPIPIAIDKDSSLIASPEINERYLPKTVANSSVIKCIGNVEPVKVPNIITLQPVEMTTTAAPPQETPIRYKKTKKKYDPIEMYRKIIGTEEDDADDDNNVIDKEDDRNESFSIEQADTAETTEKPRSTALNLSNFTATHWRKNYKYTYQYQEY